MTSRKTGTQTEVLVLVEHPMAPGGPDRHGGQPMPAHYIKMMIFALNGKVVAEAALGPEVASNPLTTIVLDQARPGDRVSVTWTDTRGERGGADIIIP